MSSALVARVILWLWFLGAGYVGYQRILPRLAAPAVPAIVIGLTASLLYAYFRFGAVRRWADGLPLRSIVLVHLSRFVGIYFLWLYREGRLPYAFAVPGGIGDVVVASLALVLILRPLAEEDFFRYARVWNVIGCIDLVLVVLTAARLNLENPWQMQALTQLPLSLLPTFLVPLLLASHGLLFVRLARTPTAT